MIGLRERPRLLLLVIAAAIGVGWLALRDTGASARQARIEVLRDRLQNGRHLCGHAVSEILDEIERLENDQ